MSLLDGENLFDSGPHTILPGSWRRATDRRAFAGLGGEIIIDMGLRSRLIRQQGRLQGESAQALIATISQIEARMDGLLHTLSDDYDTVYYPVVVEMFRPSAPIRHGRGFWCNYHMRYRQLP